MTTSRWTKNLLEYEWTESIPERETDVPKPQLITGGTQDQRRRAAKAQKTSGDVIFFHDDGNPVIEPNSVGYRDEYVETFIGIEIWTTVDRDRLTGPYEDTEDSSYSGLAGEVKRCLDKYRKGMPPGHEIPNPGYDVLTYDTFGDEVEEVGADLWRGRWSIIFINFASSISQEASR